MKNLAILLLCLTGSLWAQGVRLDIPVGVPQSPVPGAPRILTTAPGSTITLCNNNSVPCNSLVTTYTDVTLSTACPTSTQVTLPSGTRCQAVSGPFGEGGFWVSSAGTYYYTKTLPTGGAVPGPIYGPYVVSVGAGINSNKPRIRIVANLGGMIPIQTGSTMSNGTTQLTGTDQLSFTLNTDVRHLQFIFANWVATNTGVASYPGNAITFNAALVVAGNQLYPVPFQSNTGTPVSSGGRTGTSIPDGGMVISNPWFGYGLNYYSAGSSVLLRIFKSVSSTQVWPYTDAVGNFSLPTVASCNTNDVVYGTTVVTGVDDTVNFSGLTLGPCAAAAHVWGPVAVIGEQATSKSILGIQGDSIAEGASSVPGEGFIGLAATQQGISFHNEGVPGATLLNMTKFNPLWPLLADYVDYIILHMLTNDLALSSITTLSGAQTLFGQYVKTVSRNSNRVIIDTILPRTTSSDSWATTANQTLPAWETLRVSVNNWLRDRGPNGAVQQLSVANQTFVYTLDGALTMEVNLDGTPLTLNPITGLQDTSTGGYFPVTGVANGYTSDGIHPNTACINIMAPIFGPTLKALISN